MPDRHQQAEELARAIERLWGLLLARRGRWNDAEPLTITQRHALAVVSERGPLRGNELALRMGTTEATASRTVDSLVDQGLVERSPDPSDGRAVAISLTARGGRILEDRHRKFVELLDVALAEMPGAERGQVATLLAHLGDALESEPAPSLNGNARA